MAEAYKNGYLDVTTSNTAIYTCPGGTSAIVKSVLIANVDGTNAADITAEVLDSDGSAGAVFAKAITVPAKSNLELLTNGFMILAAGDSIKLLASAEEKLEVLEKYFSADKEIIKG